MIRSTLIIVAILTSINCTILGQLHDNVWTFGYSCTPGDTSEFGGTNVFFDDNEIDSDFQCRDIRFKNHCTTSISDKDGNLQLMFNGCSLYDGNNNLVVGSEKLVRNDTDIEQTWWCVDGYNTPHGAMFLPDPYDENRYYLFYRDVIQIDEQPYILSDSFYVAKIELFSGIPQISEIKAIISDTVSVQGFTGIKHGNGIDWWIIVKNQNSNIYHIVLLDKTGAKLFDDHQIGEFKTITTNGNNTRSNPAGNLFASLDPYIGLEILKFNRINGTFQEHIFIPSWINTNLTKIIDIEFSPSGDFLYVADVDTLWQFDMTVDPEEFFGTKTVVGIYDGFTDPFPTNFWLMQSAPDGKIYMCTRNSSQYFHVIHDPNLRGIACDFRQHDYKLPTYNARAMPYFPNFQLGPDSAWVATQEIERMEVSLFPNPAQEYFTIKSIHPIDDVHIYDASGVLVLTAKGEERVEVKSLSNGIYFCKLYIDGGWVRTEKIVILK